MQIANLKSARKVSLAFDYSAVRSELAKKLRGQAARIKERMKATTSAIIEIGRDLRAVQQHLLEHGQFTPWVEAESGFTARTAQEAFDRVDEAIHDDLIALADDIRRALRREYVAEN
jgi:hypothetical protein